MPSFVIFLPRNSLKNNLYYYNISCKEINVSDIIFPIFFISPHLQGVRSAPFSNFTSLILDIFIVFLLGHLYFIVISAFVFCFDGDVRKIFKGKNLFGTVVS